MMHAVTIELFCHNLLDSCQSPAKFEHQCWVEKQVVKYFVFLPPLQKKSFKLYNNEKENHFATSQ